MRGWSEDSAKIARNRGGDAAHHLLRLMKRTKPLEPGTPIWRGESFASEGEMLQRVNDLLERQELNAIATSFSKDAGVARKYALGKGSHQLILRMEDHRSAKSIEQTVAIAYPQNAPEREVLMPHRARVKVISSRKIDGGLEVVMREVAP